MGVCGAQKAMGGFWDGFEAWENGQLFRLWISKAGDHGMDLDG